MDPSIPPQSGGPSAPHEDASYNQIELFRRLAENIKEVFWVNDPSKPGFLYVSPAFEEIWGIPESLARDGTFKFWDHIPEQDRGLVQNMTHAANPFELEHRMVRGDGSLRWLKTRGVPLRNDTGEVYLVVGVSEDITERKQAESALRQNESFLRTLLNSIPDMLFLVRRDLTFLDFRGRRDPTQLMADPTEFIGRRLGDIMPAHIAGRAAQCVAAALTSGEITVFEYELSLPEGVRYFEARFAACNTEEVLIIVRDVSTRRMVEQELRQSELRFRTLAETSFEGVAIFDKGRIRAANQSFAHLFGRDIGSLLGTRALRLVGPKWRRFVYEREEQDMTFEVPGVRPDGTTFWAEFRGKSIPYESRTVRVGTVRDISERRRNEEMRRRFIEQIIGAQEDERRRIARELHDTMAQSLTSLLVGLRALGDMIQEPDCLELLRELRLLTGATIEDAQRLARGLRPSVLDDLGFAPAVERLVADTVRAHGFTVDLHMTGFHVATRLSPAVETALYRILQEALTNVARHAQATGVDVLVERHASYVRAVVEDNGRGFGPDATQPPHTNTRGLGLLGIHERAGLLHGQASIDSSPGHGTTLSVHLPLIVDEATEPQP